VPGSSSVVLAGTVSDSVSRITGVLEVVAGFVAILLVVFLIAGRATGRFQKPVTLLVCLGPAVLLVVVGLVIPAIQTLLLSLKNQQFLGEQACPPHPTPGFPCTKYVGLKNYTADFKDQYTRQTFYHTIAWLIIVPLVTVAVGLLAALLMDRMRHAAVPKTLIFLPTAISLVGGSVLWSYVYNAPVYNNNGSPGSQTGLLSQLALKLGWKHPPAWLTTSPGNRYLEMVILIWIQAGFAMVVLNAALKAIPEDILEAARMDGATGFRLFRTVQVPMIRSTLIVVTTTIMITTLKAFDIVLTLYNGNFNTDVLARQMFADLFVTNQVSRGASLAVILFILVTPLVIFNVVQLRKERAR
jgi:alpha-glucoside transport system permease protein